MAKPKKSDDHKDDVCPHGRRFPETPVVEEGSVAACVCCGNKMSISDPPECGTCSVTVKEAT